MPNPVDYIEKYPERTIRILGISHQEWQELTEVAIAYNKEQEEKSESSKIRINALMRRKKASVNAERRDWFMFVLFKANANI